MPGLWDDCDSEDQQDRKNCPVPNEYVFDGNGPSDQPQPNCSIYEPDLDRGTVKNLGVPYDTIFLINRSKSREK